MSVRRTITTAVLGALLGLATLLTTVTPSQAQPSAARPHTTTCPADTHWDVTLGVCVSNSQ